METAQNVYNVIWVDDEIDSLYPNLERRFCEAGINVIGRAHTSLEFRNLMDTFYNRVDAVITDANFNNGKKMHDIETDLSGFIDITNCIEKYNQDRTIPFYLYTGRINLLEDTCKNDEAEYFKQHERIFSKLGENDEVQMMLQQIKQDVDHIKSPSFRIRKKYAKELEAARRIEGNEEFLFKSFVEEESGRLENVEDSFNAIRNLAQRIIGECKKMKILPDIPNLNKVCAFLRHEEGFYTLDEHVAIMPMPLVMSLDYLLKVTQDGSHDGEKYLNLKVVKYVRDTKNLNLFRSLLFIAMDLCLWFDDYSQKHLNKENNATNWNFGKSKCCCEGKIVESGGRWVCCNYELERKKDCEYSIGDTIRISGSVDHKYPFDYTLGEESIHVDKYVHANKIHVNK